MWLLETAIFGRSGLLTALAECLFRYNLSVSPPGDITIAGVAQLVEHHVANVVVEGSSPFTRSFLLPPDLKMGQEPIAKWPGECCALLVPVLF